MSRGRGSRPQPPGPPSCGSCSPEEGLAYHPPRQSKHLQRYGRRSPTRDVIQPATSAGFTVYVPIRQIGLGGEHNNALATVRRARVAMIARTLVQGMTSDATNIRVKTQKMRRLHSQR